jgi:ferredoxin-NADP reductase
MPGNKFLRLTIKNSGDFTSELVTCHLSLGTFVMIDGPYGEFTATKSISNKILLLAGGAGITPLRPLLEQFKYLNKDVCMVYIARDQDQFLFKEEMRGHNVIYIIGRIDKEKLVSLVPDVAQCEVYICGPEGFNIAMKNMCKQLGIRQIHLEKFSLH